jgi:hypothetical protein
MSSSMVIEGSIIFATGLCSGKGVKPPGRLVTGHPALGSNRRPLPTKVKKVETPLGPVQVRSRSAAGMGDHAQGRNKAAQTPAAPAESRMGHQRLRPRPPARPRGASLPMPPAPLPCTVMCRLRPRWTTRSWFYASWSA